MGAKSYGKPQTNRVIAILTARMYLSHVSLGLLDIKHAPFITQSLSESNSDQRLGCATASPQEDTPQLKSTARSRLRPGWIYTKGGGRL